MSNLYQEAIADAKRLKELAEENAKNKILAEIAPRIKRLIEAELSADDDSEDYEDWDDSSDSPEDTVSDAEASMDVPDLDVPDLELAPTSDDLDLSDDSLELDDLSSMEPETPIEVSGAGEHSLETEDGKKVTVNITVEGERRRLAKALFENLSGPRTTYQMALARAKFLKKQLKETKNIKKRRKILSEMRELQKTLIFNNDRSSLNLAKSINRILKENDMSRRTRRNRRLNENAWWLREAEGEDDAAADDIDVADDADDLDAGGGEGDSISKEDLAAALAPVLGVDEDELLDLAGAGDDLDDDLDDDDLDDLEDDGDVDDGDETYEGDEGMMEGDGDEIEEADDADDADEVIEISESMIRRELAKLRRGTQRRRPVRESRRRRRPQSRRRRMFEAEAKQVADNFGGGQLDKEHFVEVDEETLLNALAEELGSDANAPKGGSAEKAADNFGGGSAQAVKQEARRRARKASLLERKNKKLQKELKESNLFNAKLLYVNKLMQQHDLNSKQQRAIVEAIDNAKTLREAKLLYSSLTESLRRRAAGKASLNESSVRTGSASKSLRSSAPAKSGEGLDRWAVLAGIKK